MDTTKSLILEAVSTGQQLTPMQVHQLQRILSENNMTSTIFKIDFNHNEACTYEACGVYNVGQTMDEFKRLVNTFEGNTKSEFIEHLSNKGSVELHKVLLIEGICNKLLPDIPSSFEDFIKKISK